MEPSKFAFIAVVFLAYLLQEVQSEVVRCEEQAKACECRKGENECEFTLLIEELQTFTSYEIDASSSDELIRRTRGSTYFLNDTGYHPNVQDSSSCAITTPLMNDADFEDFQADNKDRCSIPVTADGETYRLFIAVNGGMPGPTLIVDEGATVRVSVINKLTSEGITIHWHGMHQKGTPWMDGVGFISQAPITPGATFDYVFTATPAGTHWYHSHVGAQRTDGLFGALVVREKIDVPETLGYQEMVDEPSTYTLSLLDWQREASLNLFVRIHSSLRFYYRSDRENSANKPVGKIPDSTSVLYTSTTGLDMIEVGPVPYWSGLINGRGQHSNSTYAPLSVFTVEANKAYRFRIIGAQSLYAYQFSIDGHRLRVIATDGHFTQPIEVDYLIVHSGERYDFILETSQTIQNEYWIRAVTLEVNLPAGVEHSALAILSYGTSAVDWTSRYDSIDSVEMTCMPCVVLNCPFRNYPQNQNMKCVNLTTLEPLLPSSESYNPCTDDSCTKFFNFGFEGISTTSAINGKNFRLPTVPYQTNCGQYDKETMDCDDCTSSSTNPVDCRCIHVEQIMKNERFDKDNSKTQIMVFSAVGNGNLRDFSHPIHLHGHSFRVLHVGYGSYTDDGRLDESSTDVMCTGGDKCLNPRWGPDGEPQAVKDAIEDISSHILKDTVIVPAGGYVVVAFPADNPGYWFLHCHIEVHQLEGMGVLIEEYPYQQHRAPPDGINDVGDFSWEVSEYKRWIKKGKVCKRSGWDPTDLELAFFILFLFFVLLSVGLGITVCVVCIKLRKEKQFQAEIKVIE